MAACVVFVCVNPWHNDRPTVRRTAPPQASRKALHSWAATCRGTDFKLKHAARSQLCFSKYFQSRCLEIIASGQGWIDFPNKDNGMCLSIFIEELRWKAKLGGGAVLCLRFLSIVENNCLNSSNGCSRFR